MQSSDTWPALPPDLPRHPAAERQSRVRSVALEQAHAQEVSQFLDGMR